MYFPFVRHRKTFYAFSGILVGLSIASILFFGLKLGTDFTGGSVLEVTFKERVPSSSEIKEQLKDFNLGEISVQNSREKVIILKMGPQEEKIHQEIIERLNKISEVEEGSQSFESIGPTIGQELKQKTKIVVFLSLLSILLYVAFSFRRISRPVKSYIYGITGIIALLHDVLIPLGIFAVLGKFYGVEITIPIVTSFLMVFGYSINDTVVVFDRIRENLLKSREDTFELLLEKSLNQSLTRSLSTCLTTLLALFAIFFFGGESLKYFSLSLILGISFGTYSSLFLATPLVASYFFILEKKMLR